jgi:hypothetical protein
LQHSSRLSAKPATRSADDAESAPPQHRDPSAHFDLPLAIALAAGAQQTPHMQGLPVADSGVDDSCSFRPCWRLVCRIKQQQSRAMLAAQAQQPGCCALAAALCPQHTPLDSSLAHNPTVFACTDAVCSVLQVLGMSHTGRLATKDAFIAFVCLQLHLRHIWSLVGARSSTKRCC